MATIPKLVTDISRVLEVPHKRVKTLARALIDDGAIRKSRGRANHHTTLIDMVRLVLAVALNPQSKDAVAVVSRYGQLARSDVPWARAEKVLAALIRDMFQGDEQSRARCLNSSIEICRPSPAIAIKFDGETALTLAEAGGPEKGLLNHTATIAGLALHKIAAPYGKAWFDAA